jgi:hypothetical protein
MAPAAIANAGASIRSHEAYQAGQALGDATIDRAVDAVTVDDDPDEPDFQVVDETGHVVETTTVDEFEEEGLAQAEVMQTVRVIGGGMIGLAVLVVVLNEIFSINSISSSSGPFSGIIDSLESTGVAALSLLVIGFLVLAANRIMGFFGGGGF